MNDETADIREERSKKIQFHFYWISALFATFVFLICSYVSMVPGMFPRHQLLLISLAGIILIVSLGVGLWKFNAREAPLARWPLGPVIAVILMLELAECFIGISRVLPLAFR